MTRDADDSWAEAQAHLLAQPMSERLRAWIASDTPYRPVYGGPEHGPKTHPRIAEPWKVVPEGQPATPGGVRALTWLHATFRATP